jgi:glutathione S-transferase
MRSMKGDAMFEIYYAPDTCALASMIALEEAGADYRAHKIDFDKADQRTADFLRINPKGRVPALVTEGGILTETPAILVYVAQRFPQAGLAPLDDPLGLARVQEFNSFVCSTLHVAHAHRMRGYRWADDPAAIAEMQRKAPEAVAGCYRLVEEAMLRGPWVMGDDYTLCDGYLFTLSRWMEDDHVNPALFPKVTAHRNRVQQRAAVKRALGREWV